MDRVILHIDFDSFFASVEQQYNHLLRGKPIGVTATNGRTCIIASSREAKVLGIKTGTRTYDAKRICPSIIFVPADFVKYFEVSKKFLNICKDYSLFVELFSIDEVFIDVTQTEHLFRCRHSGDSGLTRGLQNLFATPKVGRRFWASQNDGECGTYNIISSIKNRIREEIGEYITASIGISYNKLLAKLASGIRKPDGVFEIDKNNIYEIYKKVKLTDVCGIGERIKIRLNKIGIYNLIDLGKTPIHILEKEFGSAYSNILKNIGMAKDDTPIVPYTDPVEVKSIGRNYCLPRNEYDKRVVLQNLFELCEEVGIKLRRLGKKARTVGVSLRGNINVGRRQTYREYFDTGKEIFEACLSILHDQSLTVFRSVKLTQQILPEAKIAQAIGSEQRVFDLDYVRQINVWVSNLKDKEDIQPSLFDSSKQNARQDSLQKTIDAINDRFGDHTIRNGFLLYADKLTTVPNGYMADKYERTRLANEATIF